MENKNQPAFPLSAEAEDRIRGGYGFMEIGLTKREYFAAMAMQGMLINGATTSTGQKTFNPNSIASLSIKQADELLEQLGK